MISPSLRFISVAIAACLFCGCKGKPAAVQPTPAAKPVAADNPKKLAAAAAASDDKAEPTKPAPSAPPTAPTAPGAAPKPAPSAPPVMEVDPSASKSVKPLDLHGKLPADAKAPGKFITALAWNDKYGRNALVIGKARSKHGDQVTERLVADYMVWEGDSWTSQRKFREVVAKCEFDITLVPQTGKWSITDLDSNGVAEVTFAYHTGCRSDVSPITHKVLMFTSDGKGGTAKYALRGYTLIDKVGGTFKVDSAFKSAPSAFLAHAKKAWKLTVNERM